MKIGRSVLLSAMGIVLAATLASAQAPGFSGQWRLNPDKSDYGLSRAPAGFTPPPPPEIRMIILQEGLVCTITVRTEGQETIRRVTLDDREFINAGRTISDLKGTAHLENGKMIIRSESEMMGMNPEFPGERQVVRQQMDEEYSLSRDGATLTLLQTYVPPNGRTVSLRKVFDRSRD